MKPGSSQPVFSEYVTKVVLTGGYIAIFAAFSVWQSSAGKSLEAFLLNPVDLILLGAATMRLGRLIAFDLVLEPLRKPFTRTVKDMSGAGDTVLAKGTGIRRALGQLICCPICAGTWAAAALVYGLYALPGPARLFMTILGAIGIGEILNSLVETLTWNGLLARSRSGVILKGEPAQRKQAAPDDK
jgi:hypothetical protein